MPQDTSILDQAINRLENALKTLENAVVNDNKDTYDTSELEEEIQRMNADRSRLAQALDTSESRAERLEQANKEVSRRLITAMETIRTVVDR
ncbi:DUF4164 domain-containing protein [Bartonella sp. M0177]|uniref:DUF4164 family protein n=1 Tax=Bartonella apihabitans TaxID=2750929 RepID=A0A1U9ME43_9HYPH|nr:MULTISPECIES: DUF4164 domain-containing protein [Bartonella]AQT43554.1 protein of unknown function (DUF4164) [Bartonella apihabitans]AQT45796.1 protein of unknown function (DUF4164) [Bartonella apihabitans]MBH9995685.1 DUF4164 domain-containing protein [Bartonella sp. P0291]MBH9995971.1 DUF4164 domain-containing protein [Bartonella sp. M0192]MBH9998131.1 DUF4164 domain-containing protein [Bartonella sp. M0191]